MREKIFKLTISKYVSIF